MFATTAFFDRTYRETFGLLHEARDYLAHLEAGGLAPPRSIERLRFSRESTRLTARLTAVMAWLLVQKAIAAGELAPCDAAAEQNRLLLAGACLDARSASEDGLPGGLSSLLDRSHRLYRRVALLDELIARDAA
jgi:regulator of CtrA degradation